MRTTAMAMTLWLMTGGVGWTADPGHDHAGQVTADASMTLNNGQKWTVDEPLKKHMSALHGDVTTMAKLLHEGRMNDEGYRRLHESINGRINEIVAQCRLTPKADLTLHVILVKLMDQTENLMAGDPKKREQGLIGIVDTLTLYGHYFDHPGWTAIH